MRGVQAFPARAGMNRANSSPSDARTSVPRPRGDEPEATAMQIYDFTRSPPARG